MLSEVIDPAAVSAGLARPHQNGNGLDAQFLGGMRAMAPERADEITELEIPTGIPFRYTLDDNLSVLSGTYLGDPNAAAAAAEAVGRQAG